MPRMTRRWTVGAAVMAVLGFLSYAVNLVIPQYVEVAGRCGRPGGTCQWELIEVDPIPLLATAALNALVWFGVVYLVFLAVRAVRAAVRRPHTRTQRPGTGPDTRSQQP